MASLTVSRGLHLGFWYFEEYIDDNGDGDDGDIHGNTEDDSFRCRWVIDTRTFTATSKTTIRNKKLLKGNKNYFEDKNPDSYKFFLYFTQLYLKVLSNMAESQ